MLFAVSWYVYLAGNLPRKQFQTKVKEDIKFNAYWVNWSLETKLKIGSHACFMDSSFHKIPGAYVKNLSLKDSCFVDPINVFLFSGKENYTGNILFR